MSVSASQEMLDLGKHCHQCRQLDFLPFNCELCGHSYCSSHRNHGCKLEAPPRKIHHNLPSTKSLFPDREKDMKKVDERLVARPTNILQQDRNALAKLQKYLNIHKSSTLGKLFRKEKSTSTVLALKKSAKGDSKVPVQDRVYLWVENVDKGTRDAVFVSSKWVAGRALDSIADVLKVVNSNNSVSNEEERLHLFSSDAKMIGMGVKMSSLKSGDVVYLVRGYYEK